MSLLEWENSAYKVIEFPNHISSEVCQEKTVFLNYRCFTKSNQRINMSENHVA